jgi:catalase
MRETLAGRCVGVLIDTGSSAEIVSVLVAALRDSGACVKIISPKVGGATLDDGSRLSTDNALGGTPSIFMDAIVVALASAAAERLAQDATAIDFVRDAYAHSKAIAVDDGGRKLLLAASVAEDAGVLSASDVDAFLRAAAGRFWSREPRVSHG